MWLEGKEKTFSIETTNFKAFCQTLIIFPNAGKSVFFLVSLAGNTTTALEINKLDLILQT